MGSPQMEQNFHGTGFGHVSGPFGGGNAWPQVPHQYLGATLGRSCVILGIILLVNDIYLGAMGKSASDEKSSKTILRMSVVTTVVVGIASLFVALAIPGIIEILDYAYTFYASGLVAPVLLGLFWKKGNALAAVSSIVVGGVVSLLCVFGILPIPVDAIIVGMSASFIDYVVVALVTGKKEG